MLERVCKETAVPCVSESTSSCVPFRLRPFLKHNGHSVADIGPHPEDLSEQVQTRHQAAVHTVVSPKPSNFSNREIIEVLLGDMEKSRQDRAFK